MLRGLLVQFFSRKRFWKALCFVFFLDCGAFGAVTEYVTDGVSVYAKRYQGRATNITTIRRYDQGVEEPTWTVVIPGKRHNIGVAENGDLVVVTLRGELFKPQSADFQVLNTLDGKPIPGAPVPFVDLENKHPTSFEGFMVVDGNFTGIFSQVVERLPAWEVFPRGRLGSFRLERISKTAYTGSGFEFVVAKYSSSGYTELFFVDASGRGKRNPASVRVDPPEVGPDLDFRVADMVADSAANVLYVRGFRKKSQSIFVRRYELTSLELAWEKEVTSTSENHISGRGLAIRKDRRDNDKIQVVFGIVGFDNSTVGSTDVAVMALDGATGATAWETRWATPGKDVENSPRPLKLWKVFALESGLIAVIENTYPGEEGPVYFVNETGVL